MTNIVALGDSLTAGYGVRPGKGWFDQLAACYPAYTFHNRGISGDTTSGMLQRCPQYLTDFAPDKLFFLGGSNDLLLGKMPQEVVENVVHITEQCQKHQTTPVLLLCPIVSRHPGPYAWFLPEAAEMLHERFQTLRTLVLQYAQNAHIPCLDVLEAWSPDEDIEDFLLPDGIHLNEEAHRKIAEFLFQSKIL